MDWITALFQTPGPAQTLFLLSLAAFPGILLGSRSFFGIKLGVAGVLFSGLLIGHFRFPLETDVLHFVREFGLVLFVFSIGLQVGPGFFSSMRSRGFRLNLFAGAIVLLGVGCAVGIHYFFHLPVEQIVGILSGAVTNTPGLGAAQQALRDQSGNAAGAGLESGMAYALTYPFGILGIILTMLLLRAIFRIQIERENERYIVESGEQDRHPDSASFRLENPQLFGAQISVLHDLVGESIVVCRLKHGDNEIVPRPEDQIAEGDELHVVGAPSALRKFGLIVGEKVARTVPAIAPDAEELEVRRVFITRKEATRVRLADLEVFQRTRARITRVHRAGVVFVPDASTSLNIGDRVTVVASAADQQKVAEVLGDRIEDLDRPNIFPILLGIALGVMLGSIPVQIPGLAAPVKLGLAGGPLLVALLFGWKGKIGTTNFFIVPGASYVLRELGVILFLTCVGIESGANFLASLTNGSGIVWIAAGAAITLIPLLIVGISARLMGINYLTISGMLAGAMTDPPALEYANSLSRSQAQATAYASVYPFVMFLRVLTAQLTVLLLI